MNTLNGIMSNDETDSDSLMEGLPVQWIKEEAVLWIFVRLTDDQSKQFLKLKYHSNVIVKHTYYLRIDVILCYRYSFLNIDIGLKSTGSSSFHYHYMRLIILK